MLLRVAIESARRMAPAVPELAVVGEGDQRYVFLVGPENKLKRAPVKTGVRDGGMLEITEGLRSGQKVVSEGIVKVSDGITVKLAPPRGQAR
jgi:membrane fusion protein (multidrug efflux system)